MGEYGLVRGRITEIVILRKDVVHKGRPASPMSENENRIVVEFVRPQLLLKPAVLDRRQQTQQPAYALRQIILGTLVRSYLLTTRHFFKRFPIGTYQRIDRKFAEL